MKTEVQVEFEVLGSNFFTGLLPVLNVLFMFGKRKQEALTYGNKCVILVFGESGTKHQKYCTFCYSEGKKS
jgi:hypothetical protein